MVLQVEVRKDFIAKIGGGTELGKERGEEATDVLLCNIPRIKVITTHQS
jgi:hypothetical protein